MSKTFPTGKRELPARRLGKRLHSPQIARLFMRILIDISHPAHVHFFRRAIARFEAAGDEVRIVSRKKDITIELLDAYGLAHTPISTAPENKNLLAFGREMLVHCGRLFRVAREFRPDVMLQIAGTFIAPVGRLLGIPTIAFYDTEFAKLSNAISYPLLTHVCTPECYEGAAGKRQVRYPGYHELAYLHPDEFTPDETVLKSYGLDSQTKYFLLRFVGMAALHDYDEEGFSLEDKRQLIEALKPHGRVFISSEAPLPDDLQPFASPFRFEDIHHVIAFAALVAGESATMASEAAVLGVPALFISKAGRGYTNEQEQKFGLVFNFKPGERDRYLETVERLAPLPLEELRNQFGEKRKRMLEERINTTGWLVSFVRETFA